MTARLPSVPVPGLAKPPIHALDTLNHFQKFIAVRQLQFLLPDPQFFDEPGRIVISRAGINRHLYDHPQAADRVVKIRRAGFLSKSRCPSQTVMLADFANFGFFQSWPGLEQRRNPLLPVFLASWL
jgi:hypothetical protein